jgi:CheY-like chemotaxis protein
MTGNETFLEPARIARAVMPATLSRIRALTSDNPRQQELLLANAVTVVPDGAEALDHLQRRGRCSLRKSGDPAVVLLDIKMPEVDGSEVLRTFRSDPELRLIPVIVMTSSREEKDVVENCRLGVNACVVNPVDFQIFLEAVKQVGLFWAILNEPPSGTSGGPHA